MVCRCLEIFTKEQCWVVPDDPVLLRSFIICQQIRANDLVFPSSREEKNFIKHIFLLAAIDADGQTMTGAEMSPIAELGQDMLRARARF